MEFDYRHLTDADVKAATDVMNLSSKELRHHTDSTEEETRTWLYGEEDFDPHGYLLASHDGKPVAIGGSIVSKRRVESEYNDAYVHLFVLPEWRGKGIEEHLLSKALEFMREKGVGHAKLMAPEQSSWLNAFAVRMGMKDIRHGYMMVHDGKASEPVPLPDGYEYKSAMLADCLDSDIVQFVDSFNESFQDHWNFSPLPADRFIKVRDEGVKKKEEILRLTQAMRDGESAGVAFYGISIPYNTQNNKKAGWVNVLGVKKPHRRQGLGRALLSCSMAWLWEQGMDVLYLGMDAENSKALNLYTSLGFKVDQESVTYELRL